MIEKYIYENIANTGFKWHPLTVGQKKGCQYFRHSRGKQLDEFLFSS